jgi:23S rRNA pseudouridine1911/1915/1917 synthase
LTARLPTGAPPEEFRTHELQFTLDQAGLRLDQALARALPQYSRARLQGWIEAGAVKVDGLVPRARDKVQGGELVRIEAQLEPETRVVAEDLPVDVVYKDRGIFIINKPAGLVVHPGAGNASHTLQNALLALDPKLAVVPRAGLVHRLDKDTSGLMVVARTPEAHAALVEAIAERDVERAYLAICVGVMTGGGTIDEPIGRHRTQRTRMAVRPDGREAVTHYRVLKRFRGHTYVRAELETGRTHQIRVHFGHIGFPMVGDPVYGTRRRYPKGATPALMAALDGFKRQALHATRLALEHPLTGKALEFEAPVPADMQAILDALEADAKGLVISQPAASAPAKPPAAARRKEKPAEIDAETGNVPGPAKKRRPKRSASKR